MCNNQHLMWTLFIPLWMLISLNILIGPFLPIAYPFFFFFFFFKQFGSRSDQQNATSDLYQGSLSHIGTELGPIYLHYLGL